MRSRSRACLVSLSAATLATGVALLPPPARAYDDKSLNPGSSCTAYGPDTTAAELQFTPTGVYNPGTVTEKVLCEIPRDQEAGYTTGQLSVVIVYRVVGGQQQRVTCTLFVGSIAQQTEAVFTTTATGQYVSAGYRSQVNLEGATQTSSTWYQTPSIASCTLPPKTWLGGIFVEETGTTDYVPPT